MKGVDGERSLRGLDVCDLAGDVIGTAAAVLVDPHTGRGRWLQVSIAERTAVVPLVAASVDAADRVALPFTARQLREAPYVDAEAVTSEQAQRLEAHFGVSS